MALMEFYGEECSHCIKMAPLIEKLKGEGFEIQQFETWHDDANEEKRRGVDVDMCGGVPFFYNTDSGKWICGETDYDRLKAWAKGE
jgi:hypothetical protein